MSSRFLRAAVCAAALSAAVPAGAQAMTIRLGDPQLTAQVSIAVPVYLSCGPFDPSLTVYSQSVFLSVSQAVDKRIASGSGGLGSTFGAAPSMACDGQEHAVTVTIAAYTSGPPFKREKPAVFTGSAYAQAGVPCYPGATNCFTPVASESATLAPTEVKLR